jgi:hypothetical protein
MIGATATATTYYYLLYNTVYCNDDEPNRRRHDTSADVSVHVHVDDSSVSASVTRLGSAAAVYNTGMLTKQR